MVSRCVRSTKDLDQADSLCFWSIAQETPAWTTKDPACIIHTAAM